jgi:hypothetical protein
LAIAAALAASDNITSFSSPVTANAFFQQGDTLWVATSGGLRMHNLESGAMEFIANSRFFPDLHLTAICADSDGNLWIGSRRGYLYKRTPRGRYTSFSNYKIAGWGILSLYSHDGVIVVGSNMGVSLFDPVNGVALRNATRIGSFSNPRVNVITTSVLGDTLFLGCGEGVAYLDNLNRHPLIQRNFYDPSIWKTRGTGPVVSFVQGVNSVMAFSVPAAAFRGRLFTASGRQLLRDSVQVFGGSGNLVSSGVLTALHADGDRQLWIGSDEQFYFSFDDETQLVQHRIDGMTLRLASRVVVVEDNGVWFLPSLSHLNVTWHHGIYRFDGRNWSLYSDHTLPGQIGGMGDGPALGFAPGLGGTVWVGASGGSVKHINPAANTAAQLIVGNREFQNFNYVVHGDGEIRWGKVDALATDSYGYLWISVFDSDHGSLICYDQRHPPISSAEVDPVRARYRRFFTEPPFKTENISLLHADANNRIFAYDRPQNRLTVFTHGGNPLANGIDTLRVFTNIGLLSAIEAGSGGDTYITGVNGLLRIRAGSLQLENVDNTITNATSIAILGDIAWLGTQTNGVLRYNLDNGERRWINESSGLPSNNVISLAVDGKNGHLWVATDEGLSRLDIGRGTHARPRGPIRVFPNVFSISGSNQGTTQMTFAELDPQSVVSIYTINGALVDKIDARHFTDREWRAVWTPKRTLSPGTYIATVSPSGRRAKIILRP